MSKPPDISQQVDRILHRMAQHYEAVALTRTPPNKTDFKTAHTQILELIKQARIDELENYSEKANPDYIDYKYVIPRLEELQGDK